MYLLFKKGIRGGVSYIPKRYSKPNSMYLKSYDLKQEYNRIQYLDTNNLYDYAMSKLLPAGRLKWIDPKEFESNKYTCSSSTGCALEVDLEYPI